MKPAKRTPAPTETRPNSRLLTVAQAAEQLGTSERFPRRLIAEGRIDYVKLGDSRNGPVRIPESALLAFIQAGTVRSTA